MSKNKTLGLAGNDMDTEETIHALLELEKAKFNYQSQSIHRAIGLLQRGEKYKEMWGWLDNSVNANGMEYNKTWKEQVGKIMADIEQKYFPKPVKKIITIELEAEKDHIIIHHIDIMKADLERRKDCPKVKYTIREGS